MTAFTLSFLLTSPASASAVNWPEKPINFVVPFAAGGPADIVARTIGKKLSDKLGQAVVVENKPGAGGIIGVTYAKNAQPDGYTLLQGTVSTHAINKSYYPDLAYDPQTDFKPVALIATLPSALLVNSELPADTLPEFIDYLKTNSENISFATPGDGTSTHLLGLLFAQKLNLEIPAIPYRGSTPAAQDVAAGHVAFMFDPLAASKGLVASGKLKVLGIASAQRSAISPDIPTLAEAGVDDVDLQSWQAIFVPRDTPDAIVELLNREINDILQDEAIQQQLFNLGMEVKGGAASDLGDLMAAEIPRWTTLVENYRAQAE